jgi:hypothetical protein
MTAAKVQAAESSTAQVQAVEWLCGGIVDDDLPYKADVLLNLAGLGQVSCEPVLTFGDVAGELALAIGESAVPPCRKDEPSAQNHEAHESISGKIVALSLKPAQGRPQRSRRPAGRTRFHGGILPYHEPAVCDPQIAKPAALSAAVA